MSDFFWHLATWDKISFLFLDQINLSFRNRDRFDGLGHPVSDRIMDKHQPFQWHPKFGPRGILNFIYIFIFIRPSNTKWLDDFSIGGIFIEVGIFYGRASSTIWYSICLDPHGNFRGLQVYDPSGRWRFYLSSMHLRLKLLSCHFSEFSKRFLCILAFDRLLSPNRENFRHFIMNLDTDPPSNL